METILNFKTNVEDRERNVWVDCDIYSPEVLVKEDKSVAILDADSISINEENSDKDYKSFFEITTDDNNLVVKFKNNLKQIRISTLFTEYDGPHWEINIVGE